MAKALKNFPANSDPNLLVGFNKADDAGVYKISDNLALVQTVDFFPPIVDDPFFFGQIAAANALSDVYAMGGRPVTALNIVGFPDGKMEPEILNEILRGGNEKILEAGAVVVGGHSIRDKELKYGLSVTGLIDPSKIVTNGGAKVGDRLFLTKPLGTGLISTALKRNAVDSELERIVSLQMASLNREASEIMLSFEPHAATDITGFGFLGHASEMASASGVSLRIFTGKIPLLPRAIELAQQGMIPGGAKSNREFLEGRFEVGDNVDENMVHVLMDPQTSGGLLIAIDESKAEAFQKELTGRLDGTACIGVVEAASACQIILE